MHRPHFVIARIWESIGPLDRAARYEASLDDALGPLCLGEVTGGGSQLGSQNEIEFADIELDLVNLDDAVHLVKQTLEEAGAPAGSEVRFERDGKDIVIPFGVLECLAIYLDGVSLPDDVYRRCDINELAAQMDEALAPLGGEIRGSWVGPTETAIYIYGSSAERTFESLERNTSLVSPMPKRAGCDSPRKTEHESKDGPPPDPWLTSQIANRRYAHLGAALIRSSVAYWGVSGGVTMSEILCFFGFLERMSFCIG